MQNALRGGCHTAIVSPEGKHLATPLTEGEGILFADLDMTLITKRKRMMDSVGHYARPELLSLILDPRPAVPLRMSSPVGPAASPEASASLATSTTSVPPALQGETWKPDLVRVL